MRRYTQWDHLDEEPAAAAPAEAPVPKGATKTEDGIIVLRDQKLPTTLLNEWAQRQKRVKPRFASEKSAPSAPTPGASEKGNKKAKPSKKPYSRERVTFPDPSKDKKKDLFFVVSESVLQATTATLAREEVARVWRSMSPGPIASVWRSMIPTRLDPYPRSTTQLSLVYFSHYTLLVCVYTPSASACFGCIYILAMCVYTLSPCVYIHSPRVCIYTQ